MIVTSKSKVVHAFGVDAAVVTLAPGKNEIDDAIWAKAKEQQEGIRELLREKQIFEKDSAIPTEKSRPAISVSLGAGIVAK
jgi:hypothetical protein